MAKTIKFNLKCNGETIRTPDDLSENFDLDDILFYYRKGLLKRWLEVRGLTEQAEKMSEISTEDDTEIVAALMELFEMEKDETAIASIRLRKEWEDLCNKNRENKTQMGCAVETYMESYYKLTAELAEKNKTPGEIKACIKVIADNYYEVFKMDYRRLFWKLQETAPQSILCLLLNEKTRSFYISDSVEITVDSSGVNDKTLNHSWVQLGARIESLYRTLDVSSSFNLDWQKAKKEMLKTKENYEKMSEDIDSYPSFVRNAVSVPDAAKDQQEMYDYLCGMIKDNEIFEDFLEQGYIKKSAAYEKDSPSLKAWNDICEKKAMILRIGEKDRIRQNRDDKELGHADIQDQFVILDKFEYSPYDEKCHVYYMEV